MDPDIEFRSILNREKHGANCNLLRIGDITLLFDTGCDEHASEASLKVVAEYAKQAHYILISHPSHMQVGALPYLHKIGLLNKDTQIDDGVENKGSETGQLQEILATSPVVKIGQQTMYEFVIQKKEVDQVFGESPSYTLQNVEGAFEKIQLVSYDELKRIKIGDSEITVSASPSGNSIGGSIWKMEYNKQTIYYAMELSDKPSLLTPAFRID